MKRLMMLIAIAGGTVVTLTAVFCLLLTQPLSADVAADYGEIKIQPFRLRAHVEKLSLEFAPRDHLHPENLDRVADYIAAGFAAAGATPRRQEYVAGGGRRYHNVIGFFGPEPTSERPRIIVGAHYDSHGELPAADDNASGVAGLLELAWLLGRSRLTSPVELVGFTLEEYPHAMTPTMGSAVHAAGIARDGVEVRAMFSLEMLGYFTDAPRTQRVPGKLLELLYPTRGNFIAVIGLWGQFALVRDIKRAMQRASELPVRSISAPRFVRGVELSDHANYWNHGYPAVMITDTAFMRNPNYHTLNDTPDTLDYERMAEVVKQVYAAVMALQK